MDRFTALLNRISDRLTLPQPRKQRILQEMADDLDFLYKHYLSMGYDEEEACWRAEEKIDADDDTLQLLAKLNESSLSVFLRRFSLKSRQRMEIALWAVIACMPGVVFLSDNPAWSMDERSAFFYPAAAAASLAFILSLRKIYDLYVKHDHVIPTMQRYMPLILMSGAQCLILGFTGFFFELRDGLLKITLHIGDPAPYLASMMQKSMSILAFCTVAAAVTGLVWLTLTMKILGLVEMEKSFILTDKEARS